MILPSFKPFAHQIACRDFILNIGGNGAIFADVGTGKTSMALMIYDHIKNNWPGMANLKALVVCPPRLIQSAWGGEDGDVAKITDYRFHSLRETKMKDADIYAINFESFITSRIGKVVMDLCNAGPVMCIVDESQKMKNHKSEITKRLMAFQHLFAFRLPMSGSPNPNGYHEFFSQMRFVNPSIFHKSNSVFMAEYFHLQRGNQVMPAGIMNRSVARETFSQGFKYAITPVNKERLLATIKPYCYFVDIDDCLDLPEVVESFQNAYMTDDLRRTYRELEKHLVTEIQGIDVAAPIALTKIMKLRELTGGFIYTADGQTLEVDATKIPVLMDILEAAGDKQVIIWIQFSWEAARIVKELGKENCALVNKDSEDPDAAIADFKHGRKQYLIAHPKSGGAGLTFVNSALMVDYSLDYSYENKKQTQGRFRRPGQTAKSLARVRIIMKDSIDEIIYGVLEGKFTEDQIVRQFLKKHQGAK